MIHGVEKYLNQKKQMPTKFDKTPCCENYAQELKHNHCCETMTECVHDERICIKYEPRFRSYYLTIKGTHAIQGIVICPWCATQLPHDLYDEYDEVLKKDYGLKNPTKKQLPQELLTDEWWKKRGL